MALGNQYECWWGAGFGYEGIISPLSRRMEDYPKEGFLVLVLWILKL